MDVLSRNSDFRNLWFAQTISMIGSQISYLAIPLVAVVTLDATPIQMGILVALDALPALIFGLLAGTLVDRSQKRPAMISADLVRAAVLLIVPVAWSLDHLSMPLLYLCAFVIGVAALVFDSAYQALLPQLLKSDELLDGNSVLEVGRSAGELIGPPVAGVLIQVLKAPLALVVDAGSFLISALFVTRIKNREAHELNPERESLRAGIREGVATIWLTRPIRSLAMCAAAVGLTNAMVEAVTILYLVRHVGMSPAMLGLVFAAGSVGFLIGAVAPPAVVRRIGIGPALAGSLLLIAIGDLLIPLAGDSIMVAAIAVGAGQFLFGVGLTLYNVTQVSLRQLLVPVRLAGRVASFLRSLGWGLAPLGAVLGGLLAELVGLRTTLILAALLEGSVALLIWKSSLWGIRSISLDVSPAV